jgi:hypothetical protein
MQHVTSYIFGTLWWGLALNIFAYFVATHGSSLVTIINQNMKMIMELLQYYNFNQWILLTSCVLFKIVGGVGTYLGFISL